MNKIIVTNNKEIDNVRIIQSQEQQINDHIKSILSIETMYMSHIRLNIHNIYLVKWITPEMKKSAEHLPFSLHKFQLSHDWLGYWELFSGGIVKILIDRFQNKLIGTSLRSIHRINFTSFHIMDRDEYAADALKMTMKYIKNITGSEINLNILNHKQFPFIDGTTSLTVSNIRSWKNIMTINKKKINLITCSDDNDTAVAMILSLMFLCKGGSAYIRLSIPSEKNIAAIHLFTQYFSVTRIINVEANERIYIYAENFKGSFKITNDIWKFCEHGNMTLFNDTYIAGDEFSSTRANIMESFTIMWLRMEAYYKKILSGKLDNNETNDDKWIESMNFEFVTKQL